MRKYLRLFIDKTDYKKVITKDNVINVIGTKGAGKTTLSNDYINNKEYIVINCDRLYSNEESTSATKDSEKIKKMLLKKHQTIKVEVNFINYYKEIVNYILKSEKKKVFIEGNALQDIKPVILLKGTVIVKRTAVFKCFVRAVKRDYKNQYFMNLEMKKYGFFGKITRLIKITKRRYSIFKQSYEIDRIIEELNCLK